MGKKVGEKLKENVQLKKEEKSLKVIEESSLGVKHEFFRLL